MKTSLPLRYQETCGYAREMYPEQEVGRLSVNYMSNAAPDIGGASIGDYLIVSTWHSSWIRTGNRIIQNAF